MKLDMRFWSPALVRDLMTRPSAKRTVLVAVLTIGAALVTAPGVTAGPVILGGDDLTQHGSVDETGNPQGGWLYISKAIGNLSPNVTRSNDNTIAAIGSAPSMETSFDAGASIGVAAQENGLGINYYDGDAAIDAFFAQLEAGTARPKIVWLAGDGAANDYSESGFCGGSEDQAVTKNASRLDSFVTQGGGLMAHGTCFGFLAALLPGSSTVTEGSQDDLVLTPGGQSAFPGLTNGDINAGPWHNRFEGNFGGLNVLARSTTVKDANGNDAAVILGGGPTASITPPPPPPPPVYQGPTSDKTVKVGEAQVVLTSPRACVLPSARFRVGAREKRKTATVRGRIFRVGLKQVDFFRDKRRVARDRKEPFVAQFRTVGLVPGSRHAIKAVLTVRVKDPRGRVTIRRGTVRSSFRMCV